MTKNKDITKTFALAFHNFQQKEIFEAGGIPFPQFETYEDLEKFFEIMKNCFPLSKTKFNEFKETGNNNIVFNLPERFK